MTGKSINKKLSEYNSIIKENDEKARYFANKTLRKVRKKVGFTDIPR